MKNKTIQEQLIELYEQQIQDLVMMSKIELGDDVIAKIKELKSQIHKQQTAVEWLEQEFEKRLPLGVGDVLIDLIKQAKEMEKEQIEKAHCHNRCVNNQSFECAIKAFKDAKQYYNKTYGGNNAE